MSEGMSVRPKLPTSLKHWKYEIERIGRKYGLDFYPNIIEMANHEEISELAAYSGYPVRYHHWLFGQESIKMKKSYRWGLHIIYEMVIPTNPCYSYFFDANPEVIQKAVIAHACVGHNDFFKNNVWFKDIPTNLHHRFGDNAARIEEIRLEAGREEVDKFFEACLSLNNLFDPLQPIILYEPKKESGRRKDHRLPKRIESRDKLPYYMDPYINPPEFIKGERERIKEEEKREDDIERKAVIPAKPLRDILDFLLKNAPLKEWQQEVIRIIREESQSLMKGSQTRIMNEGWAAFWESTIMAGEGVAVDSEICPFARAFAGVQRGGNLRINPYRLGKELWDDIKFRWDTGRHGPIWEECKDISIKNRWEEFIVFKTLFDKHKEINGGLLREWDEFTALIHETREDRGFIRKAFFLPENWVLEWLKYQETDNKLPELQMALKEIEEMEARFPPYDEGDTAKFTSRYRIMLNSTSPYRFWSSEELRWEITHYDFYRRLQERIKSGKVQVCKVEIPKEWIGWAKKCSFWGKLGGGLEKIFEIRSSHNDVNFIQDFFNQGFCDKYGYYTYGIGKNPAESWWGEDRILIKSRNYQRVKKMLISMLLNLGQPKVLLWNANFNNNSEIRLIHLHDGRDLCYDGCPNCGKVAPGIKETLARLYLIWNKAKPVHLETIYTEWPRIKPPWYYWYPRSYEEDDREDKPELEKPAHEWRRYSYDGDSHHEKNLEFAHVEDAEKIKDILPFVPDDLLPPKSKSTF